MTSSACGFSLARRLREGEKVFIGWCLSGSPLVAEQVAREGFVAVNVDQQHGLYDVTTTMQAIGAIRAAGSAPIVRLPLHDFAAVSRVLDMGAEGTIAPMINTADDARAYVAAAKFPPVGERSWGPIRALMLDNFSDPKNYLQNANRDTITMAMIETRRALDNVDAIAAVPGIDMLFVGPSDLSITLSGGSVLDPHSGDVEAAVDRIAAAAKKAGKYAGIFCADAARAAACAKRGYQLMAVMSDIGMLRGGIAAQLKVLKG
ncbi:MAG TPA: aldolase/citrate lyase family protein [Pseudorhodoplanes sp.]|nr:aldolase/citrate lyase family protein [Pseudorhodoplanes sp.]